MKSQNSVGSRLPAGLRYLLALLLAYASGCAGKPSPRPPLTRAEVQEQVERDFFIIRDLRLKSYLENLQRRLLANAGLSISLSVARTHEPFAKSYPGSIILISSGFIESCDSEAELAFVLAHEFGHVLLNHHADAVGSLSSEELRTREFSADKFAAGVLMRAGYSLRGAFSSIERMNSAWDFYGESEDSEYPSAAERIAKLGFTEVCLNYGRCGVEGTETTRDFAKMKSIILQLQ